MKQSLKNNFTWPKLKSGESLMIGLYFICLIITLVNFNSFNRLALLMAGALLLTLGIKKSGYFLALAVAYYFIWLMPGASVWWQYLLGFCFACILVFAAWKFLKNNFQECGSAEIVLIALLILPLKWFSLDQFGLTCVLATTTALLGWNNFELKKIWLFYLFSIIAFFCQPLIGAALLLLVISLNLKQSKFKWKEQVYGLILFFCISFWPIFLFFTTGQTLDGWQVYLAKIASLKMPGFYLPNNGGIFSNFINAYSLNFVWLIVSLSIWGLVVAGKKHNLTTILIYLSQSLSLFLSFGLLNFFIKEPGNQNGGWLLVGSVVWLLPFMIFGLEKLVKKIMAAPTMIRLSWLAWILILSLAALYF